MTEYAWIKYDSGDGKVYIRDTENAWTSLSDVIGLVAHADTHESGGSDVIDLTGLDGSGLTDIPTEAEVDELDTVVTTIASSATPTPARASKYTLYEITALATDPTFGAPTGTPQKGDRLLFWITDDGTGRTISRNAVYENGTAEMASGTTASTKLTELYIYNGTKWQCVYSAEDV